MTRRQRRLAVIGGLGAVLLVAVVFFAFALQSQAAFFYSPSEIRERQVAPGTAVRLGGLVKEGSVVKAGTETSFVVTDGAGEMTAHFTGILPDLFKEGQGVVVEGSLASDGSFAATNVLAKHDENYMPREVVDALKARGEWQRETTSP